MSDDLANRIQKALEAAGMSIQGLADKCGVTRTAVAYWVDGQTKNLKNEYLFSAAKALGVRAEWLALGTGLMHDQSIEFEHIPMVESFYHGGDGDGMEHAETPVFIQHLSFRRDWLLHEGLSPEHLKVAMVHGDSMEPVLKEANVILVDKREDSVDKIVNGKIYAVAFMGKPLVKRAYRQELGGLVLKSEKNGYREVFVESNELQDLLIVGRVVWAGGKVD